MAARTIPPSDELTRRIKAAGAYGGFSSVGEFAEEIGLGRNTLFRIFRGERGLKEMEARQMCIVSGLPLNWFEMRLSTSSEEEPQESGDRPKMPSPRPMPLSTPAPRSRRAAS